MALVARCRFDWVNAIDSGVSRLIRLQTAGFPGRRSRLATFTWVVTPSAQLTVATTIELLGMIGAMAVTVPHAKCPLLVGGRARGDHSRSPEFAKSFFCEATGMISQNSLDVKKLL